jgi:hypothetical protein
MKQRGIQLILVNIPLISNRILPLLEPIFQCVYQNVRSCKMCPYSIAKTLDSVQAHDIEFKVSDLICVNTWSNEQC